MKFIYHCHNVHNFAVDKKEISTNVDESQLSTILIFLLNDFVHSKLIQIVQLAVLLHTPSSLCPILAVCVVQSSTPKTRKHGTILLTLFCVCFANQGPVVKASPSGSQENQHPAAHF